MITNIVKSNYLKKKFLEFIKLRSNFQNIISLRAFSYSIFNIKNKYKSKMLNLNILEYINVYKIKNVNLNIPLGIIQKNSVVLNNFKNPILSETIQNNFYYNLIFGNRYKYLNKRYDLIIKEKGDIYYFKINDNKSNYYHFLNDNLVPLIFFLENYKKDIKILFNSNISSSINSYLSLISKIYKRKIIKFKNNRNIFVKNLVYAQPLTYSKDGLFYIHNKNSKTIKNLTNAVYSIYNYPIKFKKNKNNEAFINNQFISNVVSTDQYNSIDEFIKKLIKSKIIKRKKKLNYFLARKKSSGYRNRILENNEMIENYFKSKNFKIIYFDTMSITKQIECMINSNIVVGIHGANLANCIFKSKKTKLIEFYPSDSQINADFYKYISEQRNLDYHRINCQYNKDQKLILDLKVLETLLKKLS